MSAELGKRWVTLGACHLKINNFRTSIKCWLLRKVEILEHVMTHWNVFMRNELIFVLLFYVSYLSIWLAYMICI